MIIRLPEQFIHTSNGYNNYAYVDRGILYVKGYVNYEDLMYNLAYKLNGYNRCCYCKKILTYNTRTLDHVYPRSWGGISIPDNLLPCCKTCNQFKSDMTPEQFKKCSQLSTLKRQNSYYQYCLAENTKVIEAGNFILPPEWISMYDTSELAKFISFKYLEKKKMQKLKEYYERNHQYPQPIIVSSNDWLFKGKHIVYHARNIKKPIVPAIILENVVVIKDTS